jgi:hypothetical protein
MKTYNLEERTFLFSKQTAILARKAKLNISNEAYFRQLILSSIIVKISKKKDP